MTKRLCCHYKNYATATKYMRNFLRNHIMIILGVCVTEKNQKSI